MKKTVLLIPFVCFVFFTGCKAPSKSLLTKAECISDMEETQRIIKLEKGALDRWNNGDPTGYLELYSDNLTYFDESTKTRVDGLDAIKERWADLAGQIYSARYEMINPKVQWLGQTGILSYYLLTYSKEGNVTSRWNCTEVYSKEQEQLKIVHSHWSFTKH